MATIGLDITGTVTVKLDPETTLAMGSLETAVRQLTLALRMHTTAMDRHLPAPEADRQTLDTASSVVIQHVAADAPPSNDVSHETQIVTAPAETIDKVRSSTPKPEAVASKVWYTEERKAKLRAMYPSSSTPAEIMTALRALPGPALPVWGTIQTYAIQSLRIHRKEAPAGTSRLAHAMTIPGNTPIDLSKPIPVDFGTARAKASLWGVDFKAWSDLAALNQHALRIGHPQFIRE